MQKPGRVALVTGGNRGIGLEIARGLAKLGVSVVVGSRDPKSGAAAAKKLAHDGLEVSVVELDVADAASIAAATAGILERSGRIDALVNNAGVLLKSDGRASSVDVGTIRSTLEANVTGAWAMSQAVLPAMRRQRYGRIVNVSSDMGRLGDIRGSGGDTAAYRLSKAALNALTLLFASEVKGENILVNATSPGWVRTRMGGSGAPRSVEQGADTPIWLATLPDGGPSGEIFRDRELLEW